jgi:hypothetical protein
VLLVAQQHMATPRSQQHAACPHSGIAASSQETGRPCRAGSAAAAQAGRKQKPWSPDCESPHVKARDTEQIQAKSLHDWVDSACKSAVQRVKSGCC